MKFAPNFLEHAQASAVRVRNTAALAAFTCFAIGTEAGYPPETTLPCMELTIGALAFHALYQAIENRQQS